MTHVGLLSAAWATAQAEERLTKSSTSRSPRILGVMGGPLIVVSAFLSWIAPATSAEGTSMPVSLFWSTEFSTMDSDPSFFASAGFIVILIGAVTVTG
ncbi:MAG TPA: hypothetical protein VF097_11180 [Actinomycetota bacterium]